MSLLEVTNLTKYYPLSRSLSEIITSKRRRWIKACDGLDFAIEPGETLGLVGESGSGKTTAGRTLLLLESPTAGKIVFQGQDLLALSAKDLRKARRDMQIIFQDPYASLNPRSSVSQTVLHPLKTHGLIKTKKEGEDTVEELLQMVGLPQDCGQRYPHEMSGGQRQRVCIARAIALRPKLIVEDEPLSALDVSVQAQILNLLKRLQSDLGLTYLFISHDLRVVKHVSSRVAVMYAGKIVEMGKTRDIFFHPHHPYTKALLSAIPRPVPGARERVILKGEPASPVDLPPGCRFKDRCSYVSKSCYPAEPEMRSIDSDHFSRCILD